MCRFLLAKSKKLIKPYQLLHSFSLMAKNSKAFDGDWQGDGWGIAWLEAKSWKLYKSLSPIWEEFGKFNNFPKTNLFAIHARSASFSKHKNNIDYNQPFIADSRIFVFNGFLKGVRFPYQIPGDIGAQKIWYLLQKQLKTVKPVTALKNIKQLLKNNTKEIQALNIGLADINNIYSLNYYTKHPDYYQLFHYQSENIELICSERIGVD
ncbi:hypothetical protein A3A46_01850 [Candidatus Roizmanbacteria bacterium RIFCSPLOWO2_01_FULL_37_13]|uniref:Glutamine amidotransferase type-2 domain-containing protein n=1 Tax=Candidatus Roizmanbacteria bacterium RIFCSPHIGHO2_02_FULL_38_11 TaxID=1802039 RepID=A0A1F7H1T7_9BACT|nr:MAG: hypothetical protein A3C25_03070 [Candidatus Roizmanbacteria bacterium RIFCSPHIGHO2_02_FULL_38_11]OGK42657.1 MAG: hypothetical protein A3A46_01850 [Candidatus Roizmanbacteria bacterium RIFCSPLOWO2_01_FULL_37_13]